MHQFPKLKCFSTRLAVVFTQYIEVKCLVENEDVVGASPVGAAPTTSALSTDLSDQQFHCLLKCILY